MLNIGNKKLKDANIGTTPLDSIQMKLQSIQELQSVMVSMN